MSNTVNLGNSAPSIPTPNELSGPNVLPASSEVTPRVPLHFDLGFPRLTVDTLGIRKPVDIAAIFAESDRLRLESIVAGSVALAGNTRIAMQEYLQLIMQIQQLTSVIAEASQQRVGLEEQKETLKETLQTKQAELAALNPESAEAILLSEQINALTLQLGELDTEIIENDEFLTLNLEQMEELLELAQPFINSPQAGKLESALESIKNSTALNEIIINGLIEDRAKINRAASRLVNWAATAEELATQYIDTDDSTRLRAATHADMRSPDLKHQIKREEEILFSTQINSLTSQLGSLNAEIRENGGLLTSNLAQMGEILELSRASFNSVGSGDLENILESIKNSTALNEIVINGPVEDGTRLRTAIHADMPSPDLKRELERQTQITAASVSAVIEALFLLKADIPDNPNQRIRLDL